jgi:hypothetical protein
MVLLAALTLEGVVVVLVELVLLVVQLQVELVVQVII